MFGFGQVVCKREPLSVPCVFTREEDAVGAVGKFAQGKRDKGADFFTVAEGLQAIGDSRGAGFFRAAGSICAGGCAFSGCVCIEGAGINVLLKNDAVIRRGDDAKTAGQVSSSQKLKADASAPVQR